MRRRLVLLVAAATSTVALAFVVPLALVVRSLADDRARQPAEQVAQGLAPVVALADDEPFVEAAIASASASIEGDVTLFLPDGRTLGAPASADAEVARSRQDAQPREVEQDGDLIVLLPIAAESGVSVIRVTVPDAARTRGVGRAWLILGGLGLLLVGGATALADRLARRTLDAIVAVENAAGALVAGDLSARAEVVDPPEVARVATALQRLASRIEVLLADERERAADLSHRLRTPLTTLRLDVDALLDPDQRGRLEDDVVALEAAVDRLIEDARRPAREGVGPVSDLRAVLRERTAFWEPLAQDDERHVDVALTGGQAIVAIAPSDAAALMDVLLDNVFSHTAPGIPLRVTLDRDDSMIVVGVEDGGPGLASGVDALGRGISGASSTGLGLDIARRTVQRAGGTLTLGRSDRLGGLHVTIRLPALDDGGQADRAGLGRA